MNVDKTNKLFPIVQKFRSAQNIQQKRELDPILELIKSYGYTSSQIYASIGEDAAAIRIDPHSSQLILLTTDAIVPEFIASAPWGAGYSSVYVGVEDIITCGGLPLACSTTVAYQNESIGKEIFRGVLDGTRRFEVPLIRGHTRTDSPSLSLTSTTIGQTDCDHFISIHNTQPNDIILFIYDPAGQSAKSNRFYWDTITQTNTKSFYKKRTFFRTLSAQKLIHSTKDISNGGLLGTVYQLCKYANTGAILNLEVLDNLNPFSKNGYSMEELLFLFLTSAFILTCSSEHIQQIKDVVVQCDMKIIQLGTAQKATKIILEYQHQFMDLITLG